MSDFPQLEKLREISERSQTAGDFLTWLASEKDLQLAQWDSDGEQLVPFHYNFQELLAEFFDIDLVEAEKEKSLMLEMLRSAP